MSMDLPTVVSAVIYWGVLPTILIGLFFFSTTICSRVPDGEPKTSANAGFWAGLVLFVIFAVAQLPYVQEPQFRPGTRLSLDWGPTFLGVVLGFGLMWVMRYVVPTRFVGVLVLLLTAASPSALYGFVFIESLRRLVLFVSLGLAFGTLLHLVIFPGAAKEIWAGKLA
ncbi:MAG: hypothetical protein HY331_09530 [Chloroflexi bacterium]|nr:hypothetical protein [Chloroflexota bacterium]